VLLLLEFHRHGYLIAQIFFGLYLLPLGYLVYTSSFFPKVIGAVLMVGGGGYLANVVSVYLSPEFAPSPGLYFGMLGGVAELVFLLWLIIIGTGHRARVTVRPGTVGQAA
jgi:Domain of unknown function (DUF4386)